MKQSEINTVKKAYNTFIQGFYTVLFKKKKKKAN